MKPSSLQTFFSPLHLKVPQDVTIHGVSIDSRKVEKGDLFFALAGKKTDGHLHLAEVAEKGGSAAVVEQNYEGDSYGMVLVKVPEVEVTLQLLAKKVLSARSTRVVGITGSLGKTTTKYFAHTLLKSKYRVYASPSSYNSQVTLPLSILMADGDEEILLLEMGMSEPGNIEKLIAIAPPEVAVITTVAIQHADQFSDGLKGIAKEKSSILFHPKTRLGIVCKDIPHFQEVFSTGICKKQTFSLVDSESDFFLEMSPASVCIYSKGQGHQEIPLQFPIKPYYQNFLAAVSIARAFSVPWEDILVQAQQLALPPMRFERIEKEGIIFINDAFNANPDSMKAALESLPKPAEKGKTIAVLSEMNALGMYSEAGHALVAETALNYVDVLLCIGDRCETMKKIWKREKRPIEVCASFEELKAKMHECAGPGDVVLIKGARAYALERLIL